MKAFGYHEPGLHATGCRGGGSFIIKYPFELSYVPQDHRYKAFVRAISIGTTARGIIYKKIKLVVSLLSPKSKDDKQNKTFDRNIRVRYLRFDTKIEIRITWEYTNWYLAFGPERYTAKVLFKVQMRISGVLYF